MAFTYALSTDVGKVRLKIGDTAGVAPGGSASSGYSFEDEELTQFVTDGGSVLGGANLAMLALLASKALRVKRFTVQGQSYDDTAQIAAIKDWLKANGADLPAASVIRPATLPFDSGYVEVVATGSST